MPRTRTRRSRRWPRTRSCSPTARRLAKLHIFKGLTEEEETYMNDEFSKVTGN